MWAKVLHSWFDTTVKYDQTVEERHRWGLTLHQSDWRLHRSTQRSNCVMVVHLQSSALKCLFPVCFHRDFTTFFFTQNKDLKLNLWGSHVNLMLIFIFGLVIFWIIVWLMDLIKFAPFLKASGLNIYTIQHSSAWEAALVLRVFYRPCCATHLE